MTTVLPRPASPLVFAPGSEATASAPAAAYRMPHEGDRHERTWLAWPCAEYALSGEAAPREDVLSAWAAVANAAVDFEPVTVIADPAGTAEARRRLSGAIDVWAAPIDDAWIRDSGPTFVLDEAGSRPTLAAVQWVFNSWGELGLTPGRDDASIGGRLATEAGVPVVRSELVNEGGGIHVDGAGMVLLTDTVQLDPRRNPGLSRAAVEAEMARTLGADQPIWLPRGLTRDYGPYGTRGHVDMVATFARPGLVLLHRQDDPQHPDHRLAPQLRRALLDGAARHGRSLEIVEVPAPDQARDAVDWVDYSYINHLLVNGGVIACGFGDKRDADAAALLSEVHDGREVRIVDARAIFALGGGIHCITQQQPALPV